MAQAELPAIALANPTTYLMDAARAGLFRVPPELGVVLDLCVLAAFALLSSLWAVRSFRRVTA